MSEEDIKYKHEHLLHHNPERIMVEPGVKFMLYTQNNQQFHIYILGGGKQTYKNVERATVDCIRTQMRQANIWFTEVEGVKTVVWNIQGVSVPYETLSI